MSDKLVAPLQEVVEREINFVNGEPKAVEKLHCGHTIKGDHLLHPAKKRRCYVCLRFTKRIIAESGMS